MNQINDISSTINEFKNKIDSASIIYWLWEIIIIFCGEKNSVICNMTNNGNGNNFNEREKQNNIRNNRLKKYSQK
jgi:hypothetical protein